MTIGFTGDPASPIVEAIGMPISMCVAWFSPMRELVADDRPRGFLGDRRLDAELLEVAELVRHDDRRAVGERDHAEAHGRHFW